MATYYINADTGDDIGGDGSSGNPWETIAHAEGQASDNDTIVPQDSVATYAMTNLSTIKTLTIEGQQNDASGAVFDGGGLVNRFFNMNAAKALTVSKISMTNIIGNALLCTTGATLDIGNCVFHNIWQATQPNEGQANVIGPSQIKNSMAIIVTNSLFYNIYTTPVQRRFGWIGGRTTTNTIYIVTGCTFYSNETAFPVSAGILIINDTTTSLDVKNCIFRDEQEAGLDAIKVTNLTPTVSYSCWSGTTDEGGVGSITSDPLLVDPDNANFNLRPTSPCLDAGVLV